MKARMPLLALLALGALLALAPATQAATPFTAGTGNGHDLAVGSDGVGHVVWVTDEADDRVGYCRIPPGGSACDSTAFLDFEGPASSSLSPHAQVFTPAPGKVVVLAHCTQCPTTGDTATRTYRFTSMTNGATFASPALHIGTLQLNGQASFINTGDVALSVSGRLFQGQINPPSAMGVTLGATGSSVYSASTAVSADKALYAVNDLDAVEYRVFTNPAPPGITSGELNAGANWSATKLLSAPEGNNEETQLSSGTNGFYLTYRFGQATENKIGLRKFDTTTNTFGPPSYIEGDDAIENSGIGESHHSQDASGRLHVVWRSLFDGNRLRYRRSDDGGATFTAAGNLATRETFLSPFVEAGPGGTGFAAWESSGDAIRVVPIDPQPEPAGPGGGPDTTRPTAGAFSMGDRTLTPGAGTSFSFNSSEAGVAVLTVQKQVKGLKVTTRGRRRCVPQTPRRLRALRRSAGSQAAFRRLLRQRRCKAYKRIGSIRKTVSPGRNTINFNGRIAGRRLRPGRYRALLVITDSAGNVSQTERIRFRVLRRRR